MNKKEFIFVLVITFIVLMVWIASEIIHTQPSVPLNPNLKAVLDPISPNFDKETLEKVKNYTPNTIIIEEVVAPSPSAKPSPSPSASPSPSPSPSESPSPLPSASVQASPSPSEQPSPTPSSSP